MTHSQCLAIITALLMVQGTDKFARLKDTLDYAVLILEEAEGIAFLNGEL